MDDLLLHFIATSLDRKPHLGGAIVGLILLLINRQYGDFPLLLTVHLPLIMHQHGVRSLTVPTING